MLDSRHYKAFISYSHSDEHWARWLQRCLEKYKLPKTFRQSHPELPARLYPIFRDRDELASGGELSESIRLAMEDSEALIVICSPTARASLWVNEEIRRFRASGRGHRIFCLLVSGSPDPNAADCAFPRSLLRSDDGETLFEPLAADATTNGDGKRNAMLKIAAGLLGVGVDDLKRRDAQRQARFWATVAFGALFIAAITIGLAIYAFNAKKESEMRRQQAESLIGFMLGDLRKKLEPIGKLELLDSVGDQAISYFATLGDRGTPKEMLARAVALKQIGDVRFNQGKLKPALIAFEQSLAQARALYKADPLNNDNLYELGQAEFWVGYVAWERGDLKRANTTFQNYMQYSRELLRREPNNSDYNLELSYAYSNLGSLARARGNLSAALENFILSRDINAQELKKKPDNIDLIISLAEAWSWIGSTKRDLGDLHGSSIAFGEILNLLSPEFSKDSSISAKLAFTLASNSIHKSKVEMSLGDTNLAKILCEHAIKILSTLTTKDPDNAAWLRAMHNARSHKLNMIPTNYWTAANDSELKELLKNVKKLSEQEPSNKTYNIDYAVVLREMALRALVAGKAKEAKNLAMSSYNITISLLKDKEPSPEQLTQLAQSAEIFGSALLANNQNKTATMVWKDASDMLDEQSIRVFDFQPVRRQLAFDLGQTEKAKEIEKELSKAGFRDTRLNPTFIRSGTSGSLH